MDKQKDREFIEKHSLQHRCNANRCTKPEDLTCKEGYPFQLTSGYVNGNYPIQIKQRRMTADDSNVLSTWKLLVKYFNSNVQLLITADERIISYLMKYLNKKKTKQDLDKNIEQEEVEVQNEEERQLMDLIKQFYQDKVTHLQEACLAFQSEKIVETTFKVVKINQVPFSRQMQNQNEFQDEITQNTIQNHFQWKNKSNIWNRYMRRPLEFEHFNLIEYATLCTFYGRKQKYVTKHIKERENKEIKLQDYKFFLDYDASIVKLKQLKDYKTTVVMKTMLHSCEDYQGNDKIYFLEMLQLYWPHRYQDWINQTRDEYDGYKEAFDILVDNYDYTDTPTNPIATFFRNKYCKFASKPIRKYVDQHNQITVHQKRQLEVMFRFKFNLQFGEQNEKNILNQDFLFQQKLLLKQQLELEYGFQRVNQIKEVLDVFTPTINQDEEMLNKANQLLFDLTNEVKDNWKELNQSTKNIIIGMSQIYKYYGCSEIQDEIMKHTDKGVVRKSKAIGKDLYLSQQSQIRQQQQEENHDEMQIPVQTDDSFQEEIPISVLLQETLEDFHIKYENHYRNKLNIQEYNQSKVQKKIKKWNLDRIDLDMKEAFKKLNIQQRLAFVMMIQNLTFTFKENEIDRKFEGTFVHGPGGVGKSHIIATMVKFAQNFNLTYDILCPTQFAVQNIMKMCWNVGAKQPNVQTIHSFFKLTIERGIKTHMQALKNYLGKLGVFNFTSTTEVYQKFMKYQFINFSKLIDMFKNLDLLIIEEVSMMDPDFLTLLDIYAQICRQCAYPFGGIQVFLFGDSFQLQPVMQGKSNYFDSHVFKSSYFTHIIELTQSVRQAEDLEYFEMILQPIRFGIFGEDANSFYNQMQKLQKRLLPQNTFQPNQMVKAELEQKQKERKQVISLYFKNENVDRENEERAIQMIKMIDQNRHRSTQNDKKRFRQYIKQPIQFRWSNQRTEDDKMALLMGNKFEFKKEIYEANFNHQTHYLMLPIGIRNYLAQLLGEISYRIALKQRDINKTLCLKELTLFEKGEIIIRKNIEKSESLINGQFATIKDLIFDVDINGVYNMKDLEDAQTDYVRQRNDLGLLVENKFENKIRFTEQQKKEMNTYMEEKDLMNINYLNEIDVHQSQKGMLYLKEVEPRLAKINLRIGESQIATLELGDNAFNHTVNVQKGEFLRTLQQVEDQILTTYEFVRRALQNNPSWNQATPKITKWLMENQQLDLFGIDYINGNFCLEYLEKSIIHMKFLIQKLPNVCKVQISQIPINLGYARTIHCAQGSTFDNVILDLDMPERQQSGLLYTALSRVRKISNLYLNGKLDQNMFKVRVSKEIKKYFEENIVDVKYYLQDNELKDLLSLNIEEILHNINEMSSDIRQGLIQLKQEQMKVRNQ